MGTPITDPLDQNMPAPLAQRAIYARDDGGVTTFRLMHDTPGDQIHWGTSTTGRLRAGARGTKYLVDGADTFREMGEAIKTATGPGHFIYLAGWYLGLDVALGGAGTARKLFTDAAAANVQVRALLWRNTIMSPDGRARVMYPIMQLIPPLPIPIRFEVFAVPASGPIPTPTVGVTETVGPPINVPSEQAKHILFGKRIDPGTGIPAIEIHDPLVPYNVAEVAFINALASPTGAGHCAAILDSEVPFGGAHHQKVLIVNGTEGLIAFVGGIDINNDRLRMLYDVHTRVTGGAAYELLKVFNERWVAHPERAANDHGQAHLGSTVANPGGATGDDIVHVQVSCTYSNGKRPAPSVPVPSSLNPLDYALQIARYSDGFKGHPFAPSGSTESWQMYKRAIEQAKRFLYIENQYFVTTQFAEEIAAALPRLRHVTMLLCEGPDIDSDRSISRTKKALDIVRKADPSGKKFKIFTRPSAAGGLWYVHSKTLIADDQFAIVGSANIARRSFNFDSEVNASFFEPLGALAVGWRWAHRLRVRLWAEHLGMKSAAGHAALADGVASVAHWRTLPPGAAVVPYAPTPAGKPASQVEWDNIRDPYTDRL